MGAFSFDIKNSIKLTDFDDEFLMICKEYPTIPNRSVLKDITISSDIMFGMLDKYDIDITNFTEISINKSTNKYIIKISGEELPIFLTFIENNEFDFSDDNETEEYIQTNEGKISNIILYYGNVSETGIYNDILMSIMSSRLVEEEIEEIDEIDSRPMFVLMYDTTNGFNLIETDIINNDIDIDLNYGKGFSDITVKVAENINKTKKGFYIFSGQSGSGKTTYIRNLINRISMEKMVILIPNVMFKFIEDSAFISYISQFDNIVFVIEDSESLICSSSPIKSDAIYTLLSLTDGLLNNVMSVQLICTISSNIKNIDSAFLRSGRVSFVHNFTKLNKDDCNILSENIGSSRRFDKDMLLCDVYDDTYHNNGVRIGFENNC